MKGLAARNTRCPKCNGRLFLDSDRFGWYEQCLQCGYIRNINNIITKTSLNWDNKVAVSKM